MIPTVFDNLQRIASMRFVTKKEEKEGGRRPFGKQVSLLVPIVEAP